MPPPMPQAVQYFYASNGQQNGPVTFEQLRTLFANRTVNKDTLVWKQGMQNWTSLQEVEELKAFLGGNTPPPIPEVNNLVKFRYQLCFFSLLKY